MSRRALVIDSSSDSGDRAPSEADYESDESPLNQLIDLEAVESDESTDESSSTLGHEYDENDEGQPARVFTKFNDLPPELRRHIWEAFCPELVSQARIICLRIQWHPARPWPPRQPFWRFADSMELSDQTEALRTVAAVNQESRGIVLRQNPDTLRLNAGSGDAEVRFKKDRDIVYFNDLVMNEPYEAPYDADFCSNIVHAAIELDGLGGNVTPSSPEQFESIMHLLRVLPNLETLYLIRQHSVLKKRSIQWCGSRMMRHARVETFEEQPGVGEDLEWVYCWPDLNKYWDETTRQIIDDFSNEVSRRLTDYLSTRGVKLAPMVCFEFEKAIEYFEELVKKHDLGIFPLDVEEESSDEEDEEEQESSEYESEGIDDNEIISNDSSSEDELIPNPISPGGSPDPGNFSSAEEDSDAVVARFSSPEQDASDDEEEGGHVELAVRIPKRRIVSDSEDEDVGPSSKRVRTQAVVDVSSDEEDEAPRGASQRSRAGRGTQVISSDSESGSENDDAQEDPEDDDSQSESEDDEEDDKPPARLSLAERLQLHRQENPVGLSDEDNSEMGSEEYGSFIDDEEEDGSGDGLLDDMAELSEGEGEGEDDSEDGW
ncbi:unnamed protein product [Clonostachys byssicola]|uniref:2EXR domain-containing protein n=1 Tax=Clonostachys byssicola TaxID=160290 RepID=A0A9N9U7A3_9HYPO|nr:unnamed protein product [Clonostachys byssicola]